MTQHCEPSLLSYEIPSRSVRQSGHALSETSWSLAPDKPTLGTRDIHVWRVPLKQTRTVLDRLRPLLSGDEQARSDRFHFEDDRQHFIVARACLRTILARYLRIAAAEIEFGYAKHGKPQLADSMDQKNRLNFNLAHSRGLAFYAFTRVSDIGVDLEYIRPEFTGDDIAKRLFSANEVSCLSKLSKDVRHEAFFNCWTRKEAIIKATGLGLSLPLDQFDVTLAPAEPAALLRTRWNENEVSRWLLKTIEVGPGYAAAIAVRQHEGICGEILLTVDEGSQSKLAGFMKYYAIPACQGPGAFFRAH